MRRWLGALLALVMLAAGIRAQDDALNLPTELYTLKRDGTIERFGLGAAGVTDVTPPGALTIDFGVSPDGVWLAYRTESAVGLYNMRTTEQRALDTEGASFPPYRGRGQSIAWSPDGSVIAYTTELGLRAAFLDGGFADVVISPLLDLKWSLDGSFLAAEAEDNIWWVYRRSFGTPPNLTLHAAIPSSRGLAWVSADELIFAPVEGNVFLMSLNQANAQTRLDSSGNLSALPERRTDGSVALFSRPASDRRITETSGYLHEIAAGASGPTLQQVGTEGVELTGLRWAPGGRLLVALSGGVLALVDPVSAQGFPLPMTEVAAYAWGALRLPSVPNLPLSSDVYFLGDDGTGVDQVWRLPADGSPAAPVTAHDVSITAYDVALDGHTLAFVAGETLWVQTPDPEIATPRVEAEGLSVPHFNADGTQITYSTPEGVYLLDTVDGDPRLVLPGYTDPQFVTALGGLLVRIADGDLGLFILETEDVRRLGSFERALPLPDGRILALGAPASTMPRGVYLLDVFGDAPALIYQQPPGLRVRDFAPLLNGAVRVIMEREDGLPSPVRVFDVQPGTGPVSIPVLPYLNDPLISADGGTLAGYASGAGTLAVYNIVLAAESVVSVPGRVERIGFPSFR